MKFDLQKHVEDHAQYIINNLKYTQLEPGHFNASIDASFFIAKGDISKKKIKKKMIKIINNIVKKNLMVSEKNGSYINKKGIKNQKFRTRTIRFNGLLMAYHDRHQDASKSVHPHLHFLFGKDARMGKYFTYLRQALEEEAQAIGVKFNFMEERQITGLNKGQMKAIKQLGWLMNQGDMDKIHQYFLSENNLNKHLDWLVIHYKNTQNISLFIKTISIVNQRLNELDFDFIYEDINLRKDIFLLLTKEQKDALELAKNGERLDIDLKSVLEREILKFSYGFSSDVMDVLCAKFNIDYVDKNKLNILDNNNELDDSIKVIKCDFRDLIVEDLKNAIGLARSEKEIKEILIDTGSYQNISLKTHKRIDGKRHKVGFNVVTKRNTKMFIDFLKLELSCSEMTNTLMGNKKEDKKYKKLESKIEKYEPKVHDKDEEFIKYKHTMKMLLRFSLKNKKNCSKNTSKTQTLDNKFDDIERSDMYDITTYRNNNEMLVVYETSIILKKTLLIASSISSMLDAAEIKGWDLSTMEIDGDKDYVKSTKSQISKRMSKKESLQKASSLKF